MPQLDNQVVTTSKLFADGAAIEQIRANQLLLSHNGPEQIGSMIQYAGQSYVPASLDPKLEEMLYFPTSSASSDPAQLLEGLRQELATLDLEENATLLLAAAIKSSWVPECTPGRIIVNIYGDAAAGTAVLELMSSLCRRALRLVDPSLRDLTNLPAGLNPTLVLNGPRQPTLTRLIAAASYPDSSFFSKGEIRELYCPVIAYTRKPIAVPSLAILVLAAARPLRRITRSEAQNVADRFQPLLLHYRLTQHLNVTNSQFDVPEFDSDARVIARTLGAAFEGFPAIQVGITNALRGADQAQRAERSYRPAAVVVEMLVSSCHRNASVISVGEISWMANALLETRGEDIKLSSRAYGEVLRRELGLVSRRRSPGYELTLDVTTRRRIHRLAIAHDVLQPAEGCHLCQELVVLTKRGTESRP
jgi:hypothetical protein